MRRDHSAVIDENNFRKIEISLKNLMLQAFETTSLEELRGVEGAGASSYFGLFDNLILRQKENFYFRSRNRRPPMDNVNAMLSFVYSMLANDCASAAESAGLDSYVGFLHRDRPGRKSLSLDLMEELRPCVADRFVITLINERIITEKAFKCTENGTVLLNDNGRRIIQKEWQKKKQEKITHPYLNEKIEWGLIPYSQALLMARFLRGDLEAYPPFLMK